MISPYLPWVDITEGQWGSWVFAMSVIRMNVILTPFTVKQSLSTLTRKAAGPILLYWALFRDACRPLLINSVNLKGRLTLHFPTMSRNQMLLQSVCWQRNGIREEAAHMEQCAGTFFLPISSVVPVSDLICKILYPLPVDHRQSVTAE